MEKTMDKIEALAKNRGFVYPGSEIYGGLANTWDYGNLGVELKNNVKQAWWQKFVKENPAVQTYEKYARAYTANMKTLIDMLPPKQKKEASLLMQLRGDD